MRRALAIVCCVTLALAGCGDAPPLRRTLEVLGLPVAAEAVRFAVIGDSGTGYRAQYEVADEMTRYRESFPFDFVLMLGDNMYRGDTGDSYDSKFRLPYRDLLARGVEFYACLGNHDNSTERFFQPFHMNGQRYYTFREGNVRFFALDTTYLDPQQVRWLSEELRDSNADWKIGFMHHPIYAASDYQGIDPELRAVLEPLFVEGGVDVVFSGHDHFYERLKPQHGILYFIVGGAAKLHRRKVNKPELAAAGYDADRHFMLVEVAGDTLEYRAIARTGKIVDAGTLRKEDGQRAREVSASVLPLAASD